MADRGIGVTLCLAAGQTTIRPVAQGPTFRGKVPRGGAALGECCSSVGLRGVVGKVRRCPSTNITAGGALYPQS